MIMKLNKNVIVFNVLFKLLMITLPIQAQAEDCSSMIVKSPQSYFQRGLCYSRNQQYTQALEDYSKVLELDNNNRNARYNRGLILSRDFGQYDEALEDFEELLKTNPRDADAIFQRGNIYFQKGNKQQALNDYTTAISLNKQLGDAFYNRGILYHQQNKNKEALEDLERAREIFAEQGNLQKFNRATNAIRDLVNPEMDDKHF